MEAPPPLPPDVLSALPPAVIALIRWQAAQIERLNARIAELEAKLGKDSTNSSNPPSTEHPHAKPTRPEPRPQRSHGGQPGHPRHERTLVPVEDCSARLPMRVLHLRRAAGGYADGAGRPAAHRLQRPAHGLLPTVRAAGGTVPEHHPQPTGRPRLDGELAGPGVRGRRTGLRGADRGPSECGRVVPGRVPEQGGPGPELGVDVRRVDLRRIRLPHVEGGGCPQAVAGRVRGRDPLRPREDVLGVRQAPVLLGPSRARLPGVDRQPVRGEASPGAEVPHGSWTAGKRCKL